MGLIKSWSQSVSDCMRSILRCVRLCDEFLAKKRKRRNVMNSCHPSAALSCFENIERKWLWPFGNLFYHSAIGVEMHSVILSCSSLGWFVDVGCSNSYTEKIVNCKCHFQNFDADRLWSKALNLSLMDIFHSVILEFCFRLATEGFLTYFSQLFFFVSAKPHYCWNFHRFSLPSTSITFEWQQKHQRYLSPLIWNLPSVCHNDRFDLNPVTHPVIFRSKPVQTHWKLVSFFLKRLQKANTRSTLRLWVAGSHWSSHLMRSIPAWERKRWPVCKSFNFQDLFLWF